MGLVSQVQPTGGDGAHPLRETRGEKQTVRPGMESKEGMMALLILIILIAGLVSYLLLLWLVRAIFFG